ncbi:PucR family transcriptional regulator [Rhodococcus opacus]|uniref:PucR family transcriptional regulator n=1 Tax=Rhodococcus opacus TaxID=37919 RepID=UPI0022357163|nr:helix-turn-helix domain-containing protein [Rhodococcus opacus]UZG60337.1 helix-turn-helix domain-containing protein [Rhodococcus opacus]
MRWWQNLRAEDILVPTTQPRSTLSLDDEVRSLAGAGALDWAHALAVDLTREYVEVSIPELRRSVDFTRGLQISAEANILGIFLILGSPGSEVQPPREALGFADEAVVQQVPLVAVLRGYQLGMQHWLRWCAPVIARHTDSVVQADELQLAVSAGVRYIDRLSEIMIAEYERELQRRATSGAARRAALVRAVLAGEVVNVDDIAHLLNYPLAGRHMALALRGQADSTNQVEALEAAARSFAASVGATGLLTIATGLTTMDAWVAVKSDTGSPTHPIHERVTIGVGTPLTGVTGFVQSHREARRALEILHMAAPGRLDPITYYDRVRLVSLVAKDFPDVRAFVTATLGSLAGTDDRSRELRETLLAFFEANKSYTAVALSSHLHKNTVVQRVKRASELTGREMTNHVDLHVALMLVDVFGDRVLADL